MCISSCFVFPNVFNRTDVPRPTKKFNNNHSRAHTQTISTFKVNQQYGMLSLCQFVLHSHSHIHAHWYIYFLMDLPGLHVKWNFRCCCCRFCFFPKTIREKVLMGICGNNFYFQTTTTNHLMRPLPLIKHSSPFTKFNLYLSLSPRSHAMQ